MDSLGCLQRHSLAGAVARHAPRRVQQQGPRRIVTTAAGNTFGHSFRVTTFGESHGGGVGCIVDGVPPRLAITQVSGARRGARMWRACPRPGGVSCSCCAASC